MKKRLMIWLLILMLPLTSSFAQEEMFTDRDCEGGYDEGKSIAVTLTGDTATASDKSVRIDGGTILLTEEGTYVFTGTLADGMIAVNADKKAKVQIVLNGAKITSKTSAALYILQADKVFVTLAEGTDNLLENGGTFEPIDDENIDAAVYSKEDVTFNGTGSLGVSSPTGHGIVSKDDLKFTGGTYIVQSASHAIDANDSVRIREAAITTIAGKDGIRAENTDDPEKGFVYIESGTLNLQAEGDGISAGAYLHILDGDIDILAGGGSENGSKAHSDGWGSFGGSGGRRGGWSDSANTEEEASTSMKGLKSGGEMRIIAGNISINAADDAIHSNASAAIEGGAFTLASGDDAIHAEDTLTVKAGTISITESYEGLEALHIAIEGGDVRITASDDGLNAAGGTDESGSTGGRDGRFGGRGGWGSANSDGTIVISGGTLRINASGDGIDANGKLLITGGHTIVTGPTQGDTAVLDYDLSGEITGGTFIGTGSSMMAQSLTGDGQGVLGVSISRRATQGQLMIQDRYGKTILDHTPELSYHILIFSSPEVVAGQTYTLIIGEATAEITAD